MCPLCHSDQFEVVESIHAADIWSWFADQFEFRPSVDLLGDHSPGSGEFLLLWCASCDLQFFSPLLGGSAEFYDQLTIHAGYEDRWEFGVVVNELHGLEAVLDIGCGTGKFLQLVRQKGCSPVGIDHNPRAHAALEALEIEHHPTLDSYLATRSQPVSVVTAFQILEHLTEPTDLASAAFASLMPGGRLYVAVPNRLRSGRALDEPLDHPPHHVTRWSVAALENWGDRGGFDLVEVWYEPPDLYPTRDGVEALIKRRIPCTAGSRAPRVLGEWAAKRPIHALLCRTGVLQRLGVVGHSILAEFSRR